MEEITKRNYICKASRDSNNTYYREGEEEKLFTILDKKSYE